MKIAEVEGSTKPTTPEQARIKSLQQRVKQAQVALAAERQRQQTTKHQQRVRALSTK